MKYWRFGIVGQVAQLILITYYTFSSLILVTDHILLIDLNLKSNLSS